MNTIVNVAAVGRLARMQGILQRAKAEIQGVPTTLDVSAELARADALSRLDASIDQLADSLAEWGVTA